MLCCKFGHQHNIKISSDSFVLLCFLILAMMHDISKMAGKQQLTVLTVTLIEGSQF